MTKNTLLLLATTAAILTMGAGCATQGSINTTSTVDNTSTTTTKKVAAKGIDEYLIDSSGPDTYYGRSPISFSDMRLKQPQQVHVYSLGSEMKNGTYLVTITLLSDTSWADDKDHEFYFELNAAGESLCYGPFKNNILKLQQDASKKENYIQEEGAVVKSWPTYTNPTFGYSIKYPAAWTNKQGRVLDEESEDAKNMSVEFYNGSSFMLRITTDYKTKTGDPSLPSLAAEVSAPKDKTTISGAIAYKIGNLDGYKRLVTVSDPTFQGLEYVTKDSRYVYHLSTSEKTPSTEMVNVLKTFTAK